MKNAAVLIVEEEALIRMESVDVLKDAGFTALQAVDADEAVSILGVRRDIRVVFVDVKMSGSMDGLRLAHVIRDRWPPVHLVLTSGLSVTNAGKLPENALFLRKPYSAEQVTTALCELFAYQPRRIGGVSRLYQSWRQIGPHTPVLAFSSPAGNDP
jgi:DNA-binding NtrC family response regulator